jgi:hypothetical protein
MLWRPNIKKSLSNAAYEFRIQCYKTVYGLNLQMVATHIMCNKYYHYKLSLYKQSLKNHCHSVKKSKKMSKIFFQSIVATGHPMLITMSTKVSFHVGLRSDRIRRGDLPL